MSVCTWGHFPFVQPGWSDQSVLKWDEQVLRSDSGRTCNDPAHGSGLVISPGWPKHRNLESCSERNVHLGTFNLSWPEPVLFGLLDLTNGKQPKCK